VQGSTVQLEKATRAEKLVATKGGCGEGGDWWVSEGATKGGSRAWPEALRFASMTEALRFASMTEALRFASMTEALRFASMTEALRFASMTSSIHVNQASLCLNDLVNQGLHGPIQAHRCCRAGIRGDLEVVA
jgi:hypothetical protein